MKMLFARVASLILVFLVFFSLTSCLYSTELVPCDEILDAMISGEIALPAGKVYSSKAREGEKGYISASLMRALYGGEGSQELISGWIEYSFFLPDSDHPCELAVILCDSPENAKDTARLLCRRLNTIKTIKGDKDSATPYSSAPQKKTAPNNASGSPSTVLPDYSAYLDGAEVTISRNYVLLIISSDTAAAKKTALALIG